MKDLANKTPEMVNDEIAEYLKLAKLAQAKKREQAPELTLKEAIEIPQKRLIKMYCPEAVGKDAKYHAMFGDNKLLRQYAQEGYEIVTDHGQMVTHGDSGDVLVRIPKDIHDRMVQYPILRDKRMQEAHRREEHMEVSRNPASGGERVVIQKAGEEPYDSKTEQA